MNVIDSYLDTLFAPYLDSPRMREAKTELRAMMEDKQQGLMEDGRTGSQAVGTVIAEFGSLEEIAPTLGISTELGGYAVDYVALQEARLEVDRARTYVDLVRRTQWMTAIAVPIFVLAAVPLLILIALTSGEGAEPPTCAIGAGIVSVLVLVGAGILMLILRDSRLADVEDIEGGRFTLTAQVRSYARDVRREHRRSVALSQGVAIMLWILCAVPTVLAGLNADEESATPLYGVSLTLAIVALGLWIMLRASWSEHAASKLLHEEDEEKVLETSSSPAIRVIAALYWPVIVAIFLGWSFLSGDWGTTWVIWPIAGVLYAGLFSLNAAIGTPGPSGQGRTSAR